MDCTYSLLTTAPLVALPSNCPRKMKNFFPWRNERFPVCKASILADANELIIKAFLGEKKEAQKGNKKQKAKLKKRE